MQISCSKVISNISGIATLLTATDILSTTGQHHVVSGLWYRLYWVPYCNVVFLYLYGSHYKVAAHAFLSVLYYCWVASKIFAEHYMVSGVGLRWQVCIYNLPILSTFGTPMSGRSGSTASSKCFRTQTQKRVMPSEHAAILLGRGGWWRLDRHKYHQGEKYNEVMAKFDGFFKVRQNVILERACFNRRRQCEGESAEQYITVLYGLVEPVYMTICGMRCCETG